MCIFVTKLFHYRYKFLLSYIYIYNCVLLYQDYGIYPKGGSGVPCPPLFAVVAPSCALSGHFGTSSCLLVISCISLCRLRPSVLMWIRDWCRVRDSLGLDISLCNYMKRLIPALSSRCRRWTLILCAGTLDPQMQQCVARTKFMVILLLAYPHVLEQCCRHFLQDVWISCLGWLLYPHPVAH